MVIIIRHIIEISTNIFPPSSYKYTGCFIMIEIKFELHIQARIQAVSWERCTFSDEILTFLNCASKNSKEFHVFLKFGGNFDVQS